MEVHVVIVVHFLQIWFGYVTWGECFVDHFTCVCIQWYRVKVYNL